MIEMIVNENKIKRVLLKRGVTIPVIIEERPSTSKCTRRILSARRAVLQYLVLQSSGAVREKHVKRYRKSVLILLEHYDDNKKPEVITKSRLQDTMKFMT